MKTPAIWIIKGANSAIFIFIYCALISEYSRGQKRCHRLYKLGKKTCGHKKTKPQNETLADFAQKKINGCSGRDRTYDQVINSHLLYRWATEQSSLMVSVIPLIPPVVNTNFSFFYCHFFGVAAPSSPRVFFKVLGRFFILVRKKTWFIAFAIYCFQVWKNIYLLPLRSSFRWTALPSM